MTDTVAMETTPDVPAPAEVSVAVSADKQQAHLTLVASSGGDKATREQLQQALSLAGVVHGLLQDVIDAALEQGSADALLVAQGLAPTPGADAEFELLIPALKDRKPKLDDMATVDFRDLGLFISVAKGTALMRRTPATAGTPGRNVLGETVLPTPGKDTPFAPKLPGAMVDAQDSHLLRAAITGQPLRVHGGVTVEPVLTLPAVDMSSGHIDFEGSVNVLGDVRSGMKVHAMGDITVGGVVEAAELVAKGAITVKGGVIGHSEWSVGAGEAFATASIVAGGAVHTRFVEHAIVESGATIHIVDAARQSLLRAIDSVVVGSDDARSGHLIGGRVEATLRVQAAFIGSAANVPTRIEVGRHPMLARKLDELDARVRQYEKEQSDLMRLLVYAKANPQRLGADVTHKARQTAVQLGQDIATCHDERQVLVQQLSLAKGAKVVVGMKVYGGVVVKLGELTLQIRDERAAGTLRCIHDVIAFE